MDTIFRSRVESLGFDADTIIQEMNSDLVYAKYGMETFDRPYESNKLAGAIRMYKLYSEVKPCIRTWLKNEDLRDDVVEFIREHEDEFNLDWASDFTYGNLAAATLINTYLRQNEVPQLMILRVAVGAGLKRGIEFVNETIALFNERKLSLATPILLNMGFKKKAPTSCMVMVVDDCIEDIYDCLKEIAIASKYNAGIGISLAKLRHSQIANEGDSKGIMPLMRILDCSIEYVDQGGKRPGAACAALPIWHYDAYDFIMCKDKLKQDRIRRLNTSILLNDVFMERVKSDGDWYCVCPKICAGLSETHGEEFRKLYLKYEQDCIDNKIRHRKYSARDLLSYICDQQRKSGMPFVNHIDTINRTNPNSNVGMIYSLNLCQEIALPSVAKTQTATCNIGAVCLKNMVSGTNFDYKELVRTVEHLCLFLNDVLDNAHNIHEKAKRSNDLIRPIAIGVNGWAELLYSLNLTSEEAVGLSETVWGCIYYSALNASCDEARRAGPYKAFDTSNYVNGLDYDDFCAADVWGGDWSHLSEKVKTGLRNSTLTAQMPTATSAQILEATESDEIGENLNVRRLSTGDYIVQNYHLVEDLKRIGMWTPEIHANILDNDGSIQSLPDCHREMEHIKLKYRTIWEIPQSFRIKEQAQRQKYTDQARSFNLFFADPKKNTLMMTHYDIWKNGLKSSYYVRSKSFMKNKKFNVDACKSCEL